MTVETYFEDIEATVLAALSSSKSSVKICVAWINGRTYEPTLKDLARRNVSVEIIYNNDEKNLNFGVTTSPLYSLYPIDTRLSSALMHNKFCIIDDEIVITGSFNWSQSAKNSFENIVVIKNDFKVVRAFLHEFYDLKAYYDNYPIHSISKCFCRSSVYNLAILGNESGKYDESKIDIWSVCAKNNHVIHLGEEYEQYLQTQLGMKDAPSWEDECSDYDKWTMHSEFQQERGQIQALQNYFSRRIGLKIHAVGIVGIANMNFHIKYGVDPEYVVSMLWRDMYYRKIIPAQLYSHSEGVETIIREHI